MSSLFSRILLVYQNKIHFFKTYQQLIQNKTFKYKPFSDPQAASTDQLLSQLNQILELHMIQDQDLQ